MAYQRKNWSNRQSEYPNRRRLTPVAGAANIYEIAREEGLVVEEGDPFDQSGMNALEGRVAAGFAELTSGAVKAGKAVLADTATTANAATTANTATTATTANNVAWSGVGGKPATYPPSAHSHTSTYSATIGTAWSGSGPWTQNITVSGVVAADNPVVDLVLSGTDATDRQRVEGWNMVSGITTYANGITVRCLDFKPTVAMPIQIKAVR